jgi:Phage integrase family
VRFQSGQERELTGATINQRVAIVDRALRIVFPDGPHQAAPALQTNYWQRAPMGIGKPRPALSRLRVKTPKRTIVPLSVDEVARFWSSFRNSRDLTIVGLMLLQGFRSQEVWDLNRDDLLLSEAQIRVRGKGNKTRFLPLAPEAMQLLNHYLRLERPQTSSNALFVSLKGPTRGTRMTSAGLRSLFRYHRRTTGVKMANPHRFHHTFASDMVRAGVSPRSSSLWGMLTFRPRWSMCKSLLSRSISNMLRPWRGAQLPDLSGRRPSCRSFAKSVAPRSPHPRLVCPSALTHPALGAGRLRLSLLFLRSILEELARTAQLPDLACQICREDLPRIPPAPPPPR